MTSHRVLVIPRVLCTVVIQLMSKFVAAPEFVKRLEPFFEVPVGAPVVLECHVSAFPQPLVKVRNFDLPLMITSSVTAGR